MNPYEKFNQEVWWVLQKLKYLQISSPSGVPLIFILEVRPITTEGTPQPDAQQRAFFKIQELGAIIIIENTEREYWYGKDYLFFFSYLQPKFDELYNEYEKTYHKKLDTKRQALKLYEDISTPPELQQAEQTRLLKEQNTLLKELSVKAPLNNHLSSANSKKLCVLEKLKEEWDLMPKQDKETRVSWQRMYKWEDECGVDYQQLKNILQTFQEEGLGFFELYLHYV